MIEIFIISFIVALTGALSPGPVLTFTIYKSFESKNPFTGFYIVLGHAILEFSLIILLLLGVSFFFQNLIVLIVIGLIGGNLLIIFGLLTILDVYKKKYEINFNTEQENMKGYKSNSFLGGIFFSITNPYWTFWWSFFGMTLMINLNVSFQNPLGLLLFFLGHELGDFIWYFPISLFIYFGGKSLNIKVYKYVLIICGAFMISFGIYLIFNVVFFPPGT
ncbi:MAG: LysE family transporter [Candidatus Thorarchaeota archaeon]